MGGLLWQLGGLGHESVVFFFVLSGYVISYVSVEKENSALKYIISRSARIYSVAFPALLLTIALYYLGNYINAGAFLDLNKRLIDPLPTIVSALFFVNQSWNGITIFSNMPYWSLGYEVLYYVFFGVCLFTKGIKKPLLILLVLAIMGPSIILYLPIWLLGVLCHKTVQYITIPKNICYLLFPLSLILISLLCFSKAQKIINDYTHLLVGQAFMSILNEPADRFGSDYFLGVAIAVNILSFAYIGSNLIVFSKRAGDIIHELASYTFSIYLYHMPILFFISAVMPYDTNHMANIILCMIVTPLTIILLANITEKKKHAYKIFFYSVARRFNVNDK